LSKFQLPRCTTCGMAVPRPPDSTHQENHAEFLRLYVEVQDSLRIYLASLLFGREETLETSQEVALALWKKFQPGMDSVSFRRWAFGVARMQVLAFRRDKARERLTFSDDLTLLLSDAVEEQATQLEAERGALEHCMRKLPERQIQILNGFYLSKLKIEVLASQIGLSVAALYKSLHRTRLQLMDCTRSVLALEELP
jgi:RNA polymerase sigma-70 factor (ECF subfamily)